MQPPHRGCPSRVVLALLPMFCSRAACYDPVASLGSPFPLGPIRGARQMVPPEEEGRTRAVRLLVALTPPERGRRTRHRYRWVMLGRGLAGSLHLHHLLSPTCCHLKEEHDGDRRKSSVSLSAVQYLNITAGLGFILNSPNTYFLMKGFFTLFTQNYSPAFQKLSPSSLLSDMNCNIHVQRK